MTQENSLPALNINYAQKGIAEFPIYGYYTTIYLNEPDKESYELWLHMSEMINNKCSELAEKTVCVLGVDFKLWCHWCQQREKPLPKGLISNKHLERKPFANTEGDFWFQIKGEDQSSCEELLAFILDELTPYAANHRVTLGKKRQQGKVFGERFRDAMINPVDPVNLSERVIVGDEDLYYRGSSYVIQQKFKHNWQQLDDMSMIEKENMIGRNHNDAIIPMKDDRSHIKCVRQVNGERVTQRLLRQAIPYGHVGASKEEGIYFAAYANDGQVYEELINNIIGDKSGFIKDKMLNHSHAVSGNFWFIPSAKELCLERSKTTVEVPLNDYFKVRSDNGLMFYNNRDFLHQAQSVNINDVHITDRIMLLLGQTFSEWNDTWAKKVTMPPLGYLQQHLQKQQWKEYENIGQSRSAALRKGLSIKISLADVLQSDEYFDKAGLNNIKPHEIIVGNMPPLTLGSGSQVMEYLNQEEKIEAFFGMTNEYSATGHNIPNYHKVLRLGVVGLMNEAQEYLDHASDDKKDFYQSVLWSLEGLQSFIINYAKIAENLAEQTPDSAQDEKSNYENISKRMHKIAHQKPCGFLESAQLIFIVNCALHQIGEPMSIGRLDQYLIDALNEDYAKGALNSDQAQEIIDAFWLKMDQTVLYNRQFMPDYLTYGTGAVFYSAGNFPQGSALNQWVQQVTIGGYLPNNSDIPEDGCNEITLMCLRSSRRLPLNAPCLSLRVHKNMTSDLHKEIIEEAAKSILSGGSHPIIINDDKLVQGLHNSGPMTLADARDYVCDGCYEPLIAGKSEWAFSYVPLLPVVGMAMNQGATIAGAGWVHLRGLKNGWNSPPPEKIKNFDQFMDIFYTQYKWLISSFYNTLMNSYGDLWKVCPSPLFSSMTDGCMESGKDMTNGGAIYHIVAPMMCGITNAINSLYSIKKLVFDEETAITDLPELLNALWNNWGEDMIEPFQNEFAGPQRAQNNAVRFNEIRQAALALPKFGEGRSQVLKNFADEVVEKCVDIIREGIDSPIGSVKKAYDQLKQRYKLEGRDFAFTVTPGVGTFEDNLGLGLSMGASADGRLSGDPIAEDFSPAPSPSDQVPQSQPHNIFKSLEDWNVPSINIGLSNAAPTDLNIDESFSVADMKNVIQQFANGDIGSNLLTITTASPDTYQQALTYPEKYDLVRVRQGGWSEFFIAMFPEHQAFIPRRPYFSAK